MAVNAEEQFYQEDYLRSQEELKTYHQKLSDEREAFYQEAKDLRQDSWDELRQRDADLFQAELGKSRLSMADNYAEHNSLYKNLPAEIREQQINKVIRNDVEKVLVERLGGQYAIENVKAMLNDKAVAEHVNRVAEIQGKLVQSEGKLEALDKNGGDINREKEAIRNQLPQYVKDLEAEAIRKNQLARSGTEVFKFGGAAFGDAFKGASFEIDGSGITYQAKSDKVVELKGRGETYKMISGEGSEVMMSANSIGNLAMRFRDQADELGANARIKNKAEESTQNTWSNNGAPPGATYGEQAQAALRRSGDFDERMDRLQAGIDKMEPGLDRDLAEAKRAYEYHSFKDSQTAHIAAMTGDGNMRDRSEKHYQDSLKAAAKIVALQHEIEMERSGIEPNPEDVKDLNQVQEHIDLKEAAEALRELELEGNALLNEKFIEQQKTIALKEDLVVATGKLEQTAMSIESKQFANKAIASRDRDIQESRSFIEAKEALKEKIDNQAPEKEIEDAKLNVRNKMPRDMSEAREGLYSVLKDKELSGEFKESAIKDLDQQITEEDLKHGGPQLKELGVDTAKEVKSEVVRVEERNKQVYKEAESRVYAESKENLKAKIDAKAPEADIEKAREEVKEALPADIRAAQSNMEAEREGVSREFHSEDMSEKIGMSMEPGVEYDANYEESYIAEKTTQDVAEQRDFHEQRIEAMDKAHGGPSLKEVGIDLKKEAYAKDAAHDAEYLKEHGEPRPKTAEEYLKAERAQEASLKASETIGKDVDAYVKNRDKDKVPEQPASEYDKAKARVDDVSEFRSKAAETPEQSKAAQRLTEREMDKAVQAMPKDMQDARAEFKQKLESAKPGREARTLTEKHMQNMQQLDRAHGGNGSHVSNAVVAHSVKADIKAHELKRNMHKEVTADKAPEKVGTYASKVEVKAAAIQRERMMNPKPGPQEKAQTQTVTDDVQKDQQQNPAADLDRKKELKGPEVQEALEVKDVQKEQGMETSKESSLDRDLDNFDQYVKEANKEPEQKASQEKAAEPVNEANKEPERKQQSWASNMGDMRAKAEQRQQQSQDKDRQAQLQAQREQSERSRGK